MAYLSTPEDLMKFVRWAATGLGVGVFSGFMGGLLRSRSIGQSTPPSSLPRA
jgi:hypothetical protein